LVVAIISETAHHAHAAQVALRLLLNVVHHKQVQRLQVQVHDALRVDLVQAQKKVSRNDLDVAKIERLAPRDQVLKQVGWARGDLDLFFLLDLGQDARRLLLLACALSLDLFDKRATHHARGFLGDEEEHIVRLIHVLNLAQIHRLLQIR